MVMTCPRVDLGIRRQQLQITLVVEILGRVAGPLLEELRVGAHDKRRALWHELQIILKPRKGLLLQTRTVSFVRRLAVVNDIVQHHEMYPSDIERIVHRSDVGFEEHRTQTRIEKRILVVIVVAHDVERRALQPRSYVQIIVVCNHVVVYQIAQIDGIALLAGSRTYRLGVGDNRIAVCLGRVVVTVWTHLRVGDHQQRIVVRPFGSRRQAEVGHDGLLIPGHTAEIIRHAVHRRNLVIGRQRDVDETGFRHVALQ